MKTKDLTFGQAIEAMQKDYKVFRKGWNGKGIFCKIQFPDENSKMTSPYIYIDSSNLLTNNPIAPKNIVPWFASQNDMLSKDWEIFGF